MMKKTRMRDTIAGYGFLLPSMTAIFLFTVLPIFVVIFYSFTNYKGGANWNFVGLKNYINMFSDPCMKYMIKTTFYMLFLCVPVIVLASLGIATILAQYFRNSKLGNLSKAIMFIPSVCADVIIARIWQALFAYGDNGTINLIIRFFGGEMVDWLGVPSTAVVIVCFVKAWINIGYFIVIFYAGIMDIPKSHLEAAEIDGANKFQQFIHVIVPELQHVLYFVISINVIWGFQVYNLIAIMTGGGPAFATTTLIYRIKVLAFNDWRIGYACALSLLAFALIFLSTFVVNILFKPKDD